MRAREAIHQLQLLAQSHGLDTEVVVLIADDDLGPGSYEISINRDDASGYIALEPIDLMDDQDDE